MANALLTKLRESFGSHFSKKSTQFTDPKMIGILELSKKQQDEYRLHKRRKLLLYSIPGVVIVTLVSLWFMLPTPLTHQAIKNYNSNKYKTARNWLTPLTWTSPEQFVIAFNSGTVDTRLGNYKKAQSELERALKLAPADKRCMVIQNLSYSLTARAESLKGKNEAAQYSAQAKKLKEQNPKCFLAVASEEEQEKKNDGGGGGGSQTDNTGASQEQKLLEKNQEGQAMEQPNINQFIMDLNSPSTRPW